MRSRLVMYLSRLYSVIEVGSKNVDAVALALRLSRMLLNLADGIGMCRPWPIWEYLKEFTGSLASDPRWLLWLPLRALVLGSNLNESTVSTTPCLAEMELRETAWSFSVLVENESRGTEGCFSPSDWSDFPPHRGQAILPAGTTLSVRWTRHLEGQIHQS